ncbi:MAG: DUF305 domain-containing protein [Anaerolineae bacterium]|nr:DUF305 domain-containing protein [Anaerolineae bacterium]
MKKSSTLLTVLMFILVVGLIPTASADGPIEGRDGRAEVRFLEGMIDHHQMAVDMAYDCLIKAQTETVITTCQNVIDAQQAEIETMQGWLLEWYNIEYVPMSMSNHMGMMDMMDMMEAMPMQDMMGQAEGMDTSGMSVMDMMRHMMSLSGEMGGMDHGGMEGMPQQDMAMMMGMMAGLNRLNGVDYELAWLEAMTDHHDDAVHMSERILEREVHSETLELAQQIIIDQLAEIETLEVLITELSS